MEREAFLRRIRERLGRGRLARAPTREPLRLPEPLVVSPFASRPPPADPVLRFKTELEAVGGVVRIADDLPAAHAALSEELERWDAKRVVSWARSEFSAWQLDWLWGEGRALAWLDPPLDSEAALRAALLECEVGITTVDHAVFGTGTLVLSASRPRPRSLSLLPTVHLALVRQSQFVSRMGEALGPYRTGGALLPSAIHFITGPSRTSDIENDLTIGVHGPAAVSVIVWRDDGPGGKGS
jgi:L-lactate dehydrogenase complex protein LldG